MSDRSSSMDDALDQLVPPFEPTSGDWEEILRRAAPPEPRPTARRGPVRRLTGRPLLLGGIVLVLAALVATPAFGIRDLVLGLIGRTDVPFTGESAPRKVKADFADLDLGVPGRFAPAALAAQTRRVGTFKANGKTHVLWVAPTRAGGYCWQFSGAFGGCRARRDEQVSRQPEPGYVHPERLGVTFMQPVVDGVAYVSQVGGDITSPVARTISVEYADGSKSDVPFSYVSEPIDAGFFLIGIPDGHDTAATRATAVLALDGSGRILARQPLRYEKAGDRERRLRARERALKDRFRKGPPKPLFRSPPLPPPRAPLQRGNANGVTVVAGRNGVVAFDLSGADATTRALISGNADYGCFRRVPYHSEPVVITQTRTFADRVVIRVHGMRAPFLGCQISNNHGRRWPDRYGNHSAVEIPFTPAARRYFADRATARDLALFVRSRAVQTIRKRTGTALDQALSARYGTAITKLESPTAALPAKRIGYVNKGATTSFIEYSTTGRRFYVRIEEGRIADENVKPLGFVF